MEQPTPVPATIKADLSRILKTTAFHNLPIDLTRLLHTVAAVSSEFHTNDRYEQVYEHIGESAGGFPGLWLEVAQAAYILEQHLPSHEDDPDFDWIDCVDRFVDLLIKQMMDGKYHDVASLAADAVRSTLAQMKKDIT